MTAMTVQRTTNMDDIFQTMPFEEYVTSKRRDMSRLRDRLLFVQSQLDNPNFGFFVAKENNEIKGYAILLLVTQPGIETAQLLRMYAPKKEIRDIIVGHMMKWCKENKVRTAKMTLPWKPQTNNRYAKAIAKKFGFVPDSINLVRRI